MSTRAAIALARQHADAVRPRARGGPWSWTDALARAPWSAARAELPAEHEEAFRRAYAERLVERKLALPVGRSRTSGTALTEAEHAARGQGRVTLRMSQVALGRLVELAGDGAQGALVEGLIAREWDRRH